MKLDKYYTGTILEATYERDFLGTHQIVLVIKIHQSGWGVAHMFFRGKKKINELFDDYAAMHKVNNQSKNIRLSEFIHKDICMPPAKGTRIPYGLTFQFPLGKEDPYVRNCNGS